MALARDRDAAWEILNAGAMELRDVDRGEEPFLYTSGNYGPGYVSIKDLVGQREVFEFLIESIARRVQLIAPHLNFVAGNATAGIIPGWEASKRLGLFLTRDVPFVYIREAEKHHGKKGKIVGINNNSGIRTGENALIVEELVNFSHTICSSAATLREANYVVTHAASILFYDNPEARKALEHSGIEMICLVTLPELLKVAEANQTHPPRLIESYRDFLANPLAWQKKRGLGPQGS